MTHQVAAVLADFGLTHLVEQHSGLTTVTTGKIRGSTRYMSPELFGDDDDPVHTLNSDMWAFGCVVFEVRLCVAIGPIIGFGFPDPRPRS